VIVVGVARAVRRFSNALAAERGARHGPLDFLMVDRVGRAHRHGDG
jgi:hypothetical protein